MAAVVNDIARIRQALKDAGVRGAEQFGTLVDDTRLLAPSTFDERAAMPVLIQLLPTLTDASAVRASAGHLDRAWARPGAFEPLLVAFREWTPHSQDLGRTIGDAVATTATVKHLGTLLEISSDQEFGSARQMIVHSLWRYKKEARINEVLITLMADPDVSRQAMSALRRAVGNEKAIKSLILVRDSVADVKIRKQAQQAIQKCEVALSKTSSGHEHRGLGTRHPSGDDLTL